MFSTTVPGLIYRLFLTLLLSALWITQASAAQTTLPEQHPKSQRVAVLEDNEKVAYLYLIPAGTQTPDRAAVAYSRVQLVAKTDWEKSKTTGEPPLLGADVASSRAVIASPKAREFSFRWSKDGHSVALLRNGQPIALATATDPMGYSKAVAKPSRLAKPWDQKRYVELMGRAP